MTDEQAGLDLRIVRGSPTAAELGAVTAVLHAVIDELTAQQETRAVASMSAWERNQRPLRASFVRGNGVWGDPLN